MVYRHSCVRMEESNEVIPFLYMYRHSNMIVSCCFHFLAERLLFR